MVKFSACSENCNACWKSVFKISAHVENCNACSKLCWIFQGVFKTCWKFQGMLKTVVCEENYVGTACWKFQHVLKTVMHVESYVKISRCVENFYAGHVENYIENRVEVWKKHHHTLRHVLKLSGRFHFSSSILHTFAMWDIFISLMQIKSFLTTAIKHVWRKLRCYKFMHKTWDEKPCIDLFAFFVLPTEQMLQA